MGKKEHVRFPPGFIKQTVEQQIGGKITFGLASAALGARAVKNPVIAALCVVGGLMLGHALDQEVSKVPTVRSDSTDNGVVA